MISKVFSCVSPPEILPSEGGIEQCRRWCMDIFELCLKKKLSFQLNYKLFLASFFFLIKGIIALIYI